MTKEFGERLAALIKRRGVTQKELAKRAGVTEAAVSHYIGGDRNPRFEVVKRLAEALETSTDYLAGGAVGNVDEELMLARRLIARNASQMTLEEKRELINLLFDGERR